MDECKTILIVEDDYEIRETLREALEAEGYSVLTAINGQDALEKLAAAKKPALIFLDIMMPIMDGHQFLQALRSDVTLAPIPVMVASATASPGEIKGANSFIKKPLDLEMVLKVVSEHCGRHGT